MTWSRTLISVGEQARTRLMLSAFSTVNANFMAIRYAMTGELGMQARTIRRRASSSTPDFAPDLHPVLRRIYAGRGLGAGSPLALGLDQMLPIGSLPGLEESTALLLRHYERGGRILVIGDF